MAFVTLADQRNRVDDVIALDLINHARKTVRLFETFLWDTNLQRDGVGKSMFYAYRRVVQQVQAYTRKLGVEGTKSQLKTAKMDAELAIMSAVQEWDRVQIENMINAQTGESDALLQLREDVQALGMLFADLFINGTHGVVGSETGEFDGIDTIAKSNTKTLYTPSAPIDLRNSANDESFLFQVDTLVSNLRAEGTYQKFLAAPYQLEPVFKRILRNSPQIRITKDELGGELTYYGNAEIIYFGEKSGAVGDIIPVTNGLTSLYGYAVGQKAVHGVTAYPEMFVPRIPNAQFMSTVSQLMGAEMVAAVVVKNANAVAKLENLQLAAVPPATP